MKKIIIFLMGAALISSCKRSKYVIKDVYGSYYHTDSYQVDENECITFKSGCECDGTVKICGSYTVQQRKN